MDGIIREVYSPSRNYKAVIIKREKDGLYESKIYMWFTHDQDIRKMLDEEGYWGIVSHYKSLFDTETNALKVAIEDLHSTSCEKIPNYE
ncbi:hypothetical protein QFZ77_004697 [Paenibacillus sp. V4I3]|uniref:hypothetical protein n=1 Tax=Paenibacillus sp. V4I3 TaxID=3042305 RepID=UPI00278A5862|nr:hypothetical protein [Paenibacillus sp. V4I3]MDQ0876038.1 hypothetical protein [Paenibacillus sp. V4I3]